MADATDILRANLAALGTHDPALSQRVAQAAAHPPQTLQWTTSRAGPPTATLTHDGKALALASRYDPLAEARKLVETIDHAKHAGIIMLGLGIGHHVALAATDMGEYGLMIVFEPDLALIRSVFERIDCTRWLAMPNVILADDAMDRSELTRRIDRFASMLTLGTILVEHPPSRARCGDKLAAFGKVMTDILSYCRTNVATALVNATRTCANLAANVHLYATGADTDALHNLASGWPAVCVGAGPSLVKNVDLLRDPAVRRNVVVIAVQTTLKPLLDRGIRPDFVTALDYSAICRRFYENLPPLPDVTLVAEPKSNPTILENFPGPMRLLRNEFLDTMIGPLARPRKAIATGATVAHLSFYLAQHLGCDPVLFIGQDLGFSDGLYYAPGTAIHDVWAPELGPFTSVEFMEFTRIMRHRRHLSRHTDIHGRPIYSDEQMVTYLKQFERDFAQAASGGQRIIDCTEGGMPKAHTTPMPLAEALQLYAARPVPAIPMPAPGVDGAKIVTLRGHLQRLLDDVQAVRRATRDSVPILRDMLAQQRNPAKFADLYRKLKRHQTKVESLGDAFALVCHMNTIGAFHRARNDRSIHHQETDALRRQARQIERDLKNMDWTLQACDETVKILADAIARTSAAAVSRAPQRAAA
jgi:hypothetical protein